jgi:hypothetical protein
MSIILNVAVRVRKFTYANLDQRLLLAASQLGLDLFKQRSFTIRVRHEQASKIQVRASVHLKWSKLQLTNERKENEARPSEIHSHLA